MSAREAAGSHQLNGVDQRGEVGVGLVLLNDGGAQGLTCTLYEDLGNDSNIIIRINSVCALHSNQFDEVMTSGWSARSPVRDPVKLQVACDCRTCGRSTDKSWTFFSSLRPQNNTWQRSKGVSLLTF